MIKLLALQRASNGLPADASDHTVGAPRTSGIAMSLGTLFPLIEVREEEDGDQIGQDSSRSQP
jgi:hypothetical protein